MDMFMLVCRFLMRVSIAAKTLDPCKKLFKLRRRSQGRADEPELAGGPADAGGGQQWAICVRVAKRAA